MILFNLKINFRKHIKKQNLESSLNYSQYGDTNTLDEANTNSNTNMTSVDESYLHDDDHSQSLTFENFNNIINMNISENFMQSTF